MWNYYYNSKTWELLSLPEWVLPIDKDTIKINFEDFMKLRALKLNK